MSENENSNTEKNGFARTEHEFLNKQDYESNYTYLPSTYASLFCLRPSPFDFIAFLEIGNDLQSDIKLC